MKRKLVVIMACAFIMSVGLAGCQSQKEYSEKRAESITKEATGNEKIDALKVIEDKKANEDKSKTQEESSSNNTVQIPNPIKEYDTLEDAIKAAGYEFTVPKTIDGYTSKNFETISDNPVLIQVVYGNGDNRLIIRKCLGKDDISGDYNSYTYENTIEVFGKKVTLKGSDKDKISLAIWNDGTYAYSIMVGKEVSLKDIEKMIK